MKPPQALPSPAAQIAGSESVDPLDIDGIPRTWALVWRGCQSWILQIEVTVQYHLLSFAQSLQ